MGVMNSALFRVGAQPVSLTFVTGTLSRLGSSLALALRRAPLADAQGPWDTHLRRAMLLCAIWVGFLAGALLAEQPRHGSAPGFWSAPAPSSPRWLRSIVRSAAPPKQVKLEPHENAPGLLQWDHFPVLFGLPSHSSVREDFKQIRLALRARPVHVILKISLPALAVLLHAEGRYSQCNRDTLACANTRPNVDQQVTALPLALQASKFIREFIRIGAQAGLVSPPVQNPLFDKEFYQNRHRDDVDAQDNPLRHYLAHGQQSGFDPNPYFDNGWYASLYELGKQSAFEHFLNKGEAEGVPPHPLWMKSDMWRSI